MMNDQPATNERHARVLVVDDDGDVREVLRMILEKHGYEVVEAPSAEEAVRRFRAQRPDAILVDLMMEEVDAGISFVKEVRLLGNDAPIFMLSSVGDALSSNADYAALGLAGLFQKPIDPAVLIRTLRAKHVC